MLGRRFRNCFVLPFFLISLYYPWQAVQAVCHDFADIIGTGAYAVADTSGHILIACNPDTPLVPASIIKIQTALAAFHILGHDFRFQTAFYLDRENNLYIRGFGDPLLISEEIDRILAELIDRDIREINGIFVDNSHYSLKQQYPGRGESDNPFDAPVVATGVNFNTVNIRVDAAGAVVSNEPQTPTLPIMKELGRGLPPGIYRLNICQEGCSVDERAARLTAELIRALQERKGIAGDGRFGMQPVPEQAKLVYLHENSHDLQQVVASFLEYSNNSIANQVFLACGVKKYGYPATWANAQNAVMEALKEILGPETASAFIVDEGSGLSRSNRMTASAMLSTLAAFRPHLELMQLKNGDRIKSGTLKGVYNYAGYLDQEKPFVILLNQEKNTRDTVLRRLKEHAVHKATDVGGR